jgi:molybdenum cofactor cytidylyltransferase
LIVPIILAAGASSRMGRLKALCDFDGRTCIELALDACREATLAPPIVVLGFHAETIRRCVPFGDATVVVNEWAERGQTSSLKAGLGTLPDQAEAFLLYPVDFPLVSAAEVRLLVSAWHERAPGARIFIPSHERRRGHPVLFDASLRDAFMRLADDSPARAVVDASPEQVSHVDCETPYVLIDMDTPDDYIRCLGAFQCRAAAREASGPGRRDAVPAR